MARVTVEDCLTHIDNHFALVLLAAGRARQIIKQKTSGILDTEHKAPVMALRDIAAGDVFFKEDISTELHHYLDQVRSRGLKKFNRQR